MNAGDEIVTIVDAANRPIGDQPRRLMRERNLRHRATYIFVFDQEGRVLVQRRTGTKDVYPGYYDLAAGGVVAAGESYETCAEREAFEELGIRTPLVRRFDFYFGNEHGRCFGRVFTCEHDGPFTLQAEEVESVRFCSVGEVADGGFGPVTPDSRYAFERLVREGG